MAAVSPDDVAVAVATLAGARRVACYGVGREGLVMKGLAMRLHHCGLQAAVVGEMTCPALGAKDVLVASAGPGHFATVAALAGVARGAGARVLLFTAQAREVVQVDADDVVRVPARTMANDHSSNEAGGACGAGERDTCASVLPMGSAYELALWLACDVLVLCLQATLGRAGGDLVARHTNSE